MTQRVTRLKELREARGLSQYRLAQITGIRQSQIWRIEQNLQNPGSKTITALCDALECTADELLGLEED